MKRQSFQHGSVVRTPRAKGSDVWVFRYRDENRKQRAVRIGTVDELTTKAAAEKKVTMLRLSINERQVCVTVGDLCDRYELEGMPERVSTANSYRSTLSRVRSAWAGRRLDDFVKSIIEIEMWLKDMKRLDNPKVDLSKRSKTHIKAFIHRMIECGMRWGLMPAQRNPMGLVEIRGSNRRMRPLTIVPVDTYQLILKKLDYAPHVQTMVQIAMCTGLRVSEILGLRWSDFDFEEFTVHVQRSVVGKHQDSPKTEASEEVLPLHEALVDQIAYWRDLQPEVDGWVFGNILTGRPYHRDSLLADHLGPIGRACGLPSLGWHSFRHTYRAMLRDLNDVPLEVQRDLMRHANISTTVRYGGTMHVNRLRPANARIVEMFRRSA